MGLIGQALARRARACGLSIHYHNRGRLPEPVEKSLDARYWPKLDDMMPKIDILSINCPATPETHHLIEERRLSLMKGDAFLINTARGDIVDQDALIAALERGTIAGAGMDVYVGEPHVDARLLKPGNVSMLQHMASPTMENRTAMGEKVTTNTNAVARCEATPERCRGVDRK